MFCFYITFFISLFFIQIHTEDNIADINLLDYSDASCNNNPFLFLLPDNMRHSIKLTFSKNPKKQSLSFCKNKNISKTCCTYFTYDNIKTYLNDHIYTPKYNIYKTNLFYYKNIIDEHRRNLIEGFKLSKDTFEFLFSDYHRKVKEIIKLGEDIVKDSITYNWNAFCNYICNFPESLKNCEIHRVEHTKEYKHFFDFKYTCGVDEEFIEQFAQKLNNFTAIKRSLNEDIHKFYFNIKSKFGIIQESLSEKLFKLYNNSIEDGEKVSIQLNQPMLCGTQLSSIFLNDRVKNEYITVNTDCLKIAEKPCGLFNCLDDFYLQFFDIHENTDTHILRQFNFSKTEMIPKKKDELIYYDFRNEIKELAGDKIDFANNKYMKIYIINLLLYICILFS